MLMHISGGKLFNNISLSIVPPRSDDITIGFILGDLLIMLYKHTDVAMHVIL